MRASPRDYQNRWRTGCRDRVPRQRRRTKVPPVPWLHSAPPGSCSAPCAHPASVSSAPFGTPCCSSTPTCTGHTLSCYPTCHSWHSPWKMARLHLFYPFYIFYPFSRLSRRRPCLFWEVCVRESCNLNCCELCLSFVIYSSVSPKQKDIFVYFLKNK